LVAPARHEHNEARASRFDARRDVFSRRIVAPLDATPWGAAVAPAFAFHIACEMRTDRVGNALPGAGSAKSGQSKF
jgi:hypothetical protein